MAEYYGPNFLRTESTLYPEKKEKARIRFMNFSQKYMGSVFFWGGHPEHNQQSKRTSSPISLNRRHFI